ncbi:probable pectinesterase/pectinesterase inhibitor 12 [Typha angustifolia]|uniref:probable pectinesterase/pectinesterase inhibitor 12 n=1 Tax=Typha angustifolia TaxID=59011 RepID=UPI003C2B5D6D
MASLSPLLISLFPHLLLLVLFSTPSSSSPNTTTIHSICQSTPYPSSCLSSMHPDVSLSRSLHLPSSFSLLSFALRSLHSAITAATSLSSLLSSAAHHQPAAAAIQDCRDLHAITLSSLSLSSSLLQSNSSSTLPSVRAHLAAALTNKATCLDGLASSSRRPLPTSPLLSSLSSAYELVSNSLSLLPRTSHPHRHGRRLSAQGGFPVWLSKRDRRILQYDGVGGYDGMAVTVAKDGTGNFTTITEAIGFAPNNSEARIVIMVRAGVYEENVEVASYKTNIVMLGEGSDVTVITGNRSVGNGWTTFRSATVAVSGQGFLARDLTFRNTAGPAKGQAVALRINADLAAVYRCIIDGYQDTLYVHSFRQFYRECDIYGTVDFIFGNAAVVFQACNLVAKRPILGQSNVITAQSRDDPNEDTGISIQNCTIVASDELANSNVSVKTYLGRPWRIYSRTVYIESYIDGLVDRAGWTPWPANQSVDSLYYGEYMNVGPGAATGGRVTWPGYHVMNYDQASNFSVSQFIYGDQWLDSTMFPYDDEI